MSTYADFEAKLRRELEESTAVVWASQSLLDWTNDAARDFGRKTKLLACEDYTTTVVGQDSYSLPEYTLDPQWVIHDTSRLPRVEPGPFFEAHAQATGESTPEAYTVYDGALWLHPTPAEEKTLRYWRTYLPSPVVNATAPMPFASEHDDALGSYVKAKAFEQTGEFDRSQYYLTLYERAVSEADFERMRSAGADIVQEPGVAW